MLAETAHDVGQSPHLLRLYGNSLACCSAFCGAVLQISVSCYGHLPHLAEEVVGRYALPMAQLCSGVRWRQVVQIAVALHEQCSQAQQQPSSAKHTKQWDGVKHRDMMKQRLLPGVSPFCSQH